MKTRPLLLCALLGTSLATFSHRSVAAAASDCDRACLNDIAEQYLAAIVSHDPSKAPMATSVRYTENGVELPLPDGLWRIASSVGKYRLLVADPELGEVGFFTRMEENGAPILVGTRLAVVDRRITQIESVIAHNSDLLNLGPPGQPRPDVLGDAPRPQFLQTLPQAARRSRQELIDIANTYWTGIENNEGSRPPLFADDCNRIENGAYTTTRPAPPGADPTGLNYSCKEGFALGFYHDDTRLRDRRFLAIDRERGLVYAAVEFDHDATVRSYTLKNGKQVTVKRTAPWTWMIHEIFQINQEGKISQVEAVLLGVPYGMRPGWDTGIHVPDPQAAKDHFAE
jgi:hypothetical protein